MIDGLKFAAIDIGSNAVRLLLAAVFEIDNGPQFRKISLVRMPVRLGEDVFTHQVVSPGKARQLVQTLTGFKHLIEAYAPLAFRACATSALREARNCQEICGRIREGSGIQVDVIDGQEEAGIIFHNSLATLPPAMDAKVYVDVGGGSTEITLFTSTGRISRSFDIGTIRLLKDMVTSLDWDHMKQWIREQSRLYPRICAAGSGGNLHKLLKLAKSKDGLSITAAKIKQIRSDLESYTVQERITRLGLKPDRADVILPAIKIYLSVMSWAKISAISVPQMGLAYGIIRRLYEHHKRDASSFEPTPKI
jgi:exopolyphosphatase/guanosine-5'-triphosphate,3'-diphosphate pyrophosphatase